jgi:hypothetical protein
MREFIKLACLVALTIIGCAVGLELNSTLRDIHAHTVVTLENLDRNLIVLGVTLTEVQKGAKEWQTASTIQASTSTALLRSVNSSVAELRRTVANTDAQLNGNLLPALTTSITQQNQSLTSNQNLLGISLTQLQQILRDADAQIKDPAIAQSLANIQASTQNLNAGIVNLTGVTADAKNLADYEVKQLETPEKVWLAVLKFVLGYGASARGLFIGYR